MPILSFKWQMRLIVLGLIVFSAWLTFVTVYALVEGQVSVGGSRYHYSYPRTFSRADEPERYWTSTGLLMTMDIVSIIAAVKMAMDWRFVFFDTKEKK